MPAASCRYRGERPLAVIAPLCLAGAGLSAVVVPAAQAGTGPRVLLVGSYHGIAGGYATIRAALAAAQPGDWILVGPGDYKAAPYGGAAAGSGGKPAPAGAFVTTAGIHLRGMNRNTVIIDGTRPGSPPCSPARADQVGNPDPVLVVQAECAAQLFAPCPAVPGLHYPRPKASFPLPMPAAQPTMPDPCAGVPANPWCPAGG